MNIYQKVQKIRVELQGMDLTKSGHNPFANFKYFELKDFLPTINKMCLENELFPLVSFTSEEATLTIINMENTEETMVFKSPMGSAALKGCHEVQNIGATETFQRRYLYFTAFEIVEHDTLDGTVGKDEDKKPNTPKPSANKQGYKLSDAQINRMFAIAATKGVTNEVIVKNIAKKYNTEPDKMSKAQYDEFVKGLEAMESKK